MDANVDNLGSQNGWSWADQISTYRFWGLLLFYVFTQASVAIFSTFASLFFNDYLRIPITTTGMLYTIFAISSIFGFYLGWLVARWRPVISLIILGLVMLLGILLLFQPNPTTAALLRFIGVFLVGLSTGGILLGVPALLAGGRGGQVAFALAFGILLLFTRLSSFTTGFIGVLVNNIGYQSLDLMCASLIVIGVLLLLPVKRDLFNNPPDRKLKGLEPVEREPILVGLLSILPIVPLYYIYRLQGEAVKLTKSSRLLSPLGALLATIFIPFMYPIVLTTQMDALDGFADQNNRARPHQPWVIFLWTIVFPPVAFGMLQHSINRLAPSEQFTPALQGVQTS